MLSGIYCLPWWILVFLMPGGIWCWYAFRRAAQRRNIKPAYLSAAIWLMLAVWVVAVLDYTLIGRQPQDFGHFRKLFDSYRMAREQREIYRSNYMNALLFFPGGLLVAAALPRSWGWWRVLAVTVLLGLVSAGIETIQWYRQIGLAEADDILHNTLGALLGSGAELLVTKVQENEEKAPKTE